MPRRGRSSSHAETGTKRRREDISSSKPKDEDRLVSRRVEVRDKEVPSVFAKASKDKETDSDRDREKNEKGKVLEERNRRREKDLGREDDKRDRVGSAHKSGDRGRDKSRERKKGNERDIRKGEDNERDNIQDKERDKAKDRCRDATREREREKDRDRHREREKDREKYRSEILSNYRCDKERDRGMRRDDRSSVRRRSASRSKSRARDRERDKDDFNPKRDPWRAVQPHHMPSFPSHASGSFGYSFPFTQKPPLPPDPMVNRPPLPPLPPPPMPLGQPPGDEPHQHLQQLLTSWRDELEAFNVTSSCVSTSSSKEWVLSRQDVLVPADLAGSELFQRVQELRTVVPEPGPLPEGEEEEEVLEVVQEVEEEEQSIGEEGGGLAEGDDLYGDLYGDLDAMEPADLVDEEVDEEMEAAAIAARAPALVASLAASQLPPTHQPDLERISSYVPYNSAAMSSLAQLLYADRLAWMTRLSRGQTTTNHLAQDLSKLQTPLLT
jgi:hypothetical protein